MMTSTNSLNPLPATSTTNSIDSMSINVNRIGSERMNPNAPMLHSQQDNDELKVVICARIEENDVLFSQQATSDHPGNDLYHQVLQDHVQDYKNTSNATQKQRIARNVIQIVLARNSKVRFVAWNEPNGTIVKLSNKATVQVIIKELDQQVAGVSRLATRKRKSTSQLCNEEKVSTETHTPSTNKKNQAMVMNTAPPQESNISTHTLHENDVLCTKTADKKADALPGNTKFLQLLPDYHCAYQQAKTDDDRFKVANTFIQDFQTRYPPGRFVKRMNHHHVETLVEIRSSSVVQKVLRALARQAGYGTIVKPTLQSTSRKRTRAARQQEEQKSTSRQKKKKITTKSSNRSTGSNKKAIASNESEQQEPNQVYPTNTLHKHDVLCTPYPDKAADALPGNTLFRNLVSEFRESYQAATCEDDRVEVATNMIAAFQTRYQPPGRFVKLIKSGSYVEIQQRSVLQKVSRALARRPDGTKVLDGLALKEPIMEQPQEEEVLPGRRKRRGVARMQDEHEAAVAMVYQQVQSKAKLTSSKTKGTTAKRASSTPKQSSSVKGTPGRVPPRSGARHVTPASTVSKNRDHVAPSRKPSRASPGASKKKRTSSPRTIANRVSPETVPRSSIRKTTRSDTPVRKVSPDSMTEEPVHAPVVTPANLKPTGLGLLAQKFADYVLQLEDPEEIDLEAAVKHLKISKRRIYDVVNILLGAGVLEQNHDMDVNTHTFRWAAPLIRSETEWKQSIQDEEDQLDEWIEIFDKLTKENKCASISGQHLAPLANDDTTLLAVHVPQASIIRTVDIPMEEEAYAFKLTTPKPEESTDIPKACLLTNGETPFLPVDLSPPPQPAEPILVPPHYPYNDSPRPRPIEHQHGLNPLDMLLQVLPKPPPKANGRYHYYSDDDEPSLQLERTVTWDEDRERPQTPFEALLQASTLCE